jgi:ribose/xylose/arabinose/galactoside ABC-type transport system permease subunit
MNALAEARMLRRPFRLGLGRLQVLSVLFLVELAVFGALRPAYLSMPGLLDASRSFVEAGLLALGMTLVIITGGIDLSVASLLALVSVTLGFSSAAGLPLPLAMVFGLFVGLSGGLLNGFIIAGLNLHPLVVTLGTMAFFRGLAYAVTNANAVSTFPDWFADFGQSYLWDLVPFQVIVWLAAVFAIWVLLNRTSFGRYVYGLGINERVTVFSGINTLKVKVAVYTLSGFFAAIAAMIQTSRVFTARANAASGLELTVIAMVALGGTRITGGSGSILGTTLGVLILGYLQDGLGFVGVRNDWALVVTGVVLVLAVFANEFFRKESR